MESIAWQAISFGVNYLVTQRILYPLMSSTSYEKQADVYYDKAMQAIVLQYKAQVNELSVFKQIHDDLADLLIANGSNRFYVDTRQMGVMLVEGQQYVIKEMFPRMLAHLQGKKLYHVQVISETDAFARFGAKNIKTSITKATDNPVVEAYTDEQAAKAWLQEQAL